MAAGSVQKTYTVLRFALRGGGGRWVKGASFRTTPGVRRNAVTRVTFTTDLREAAGMSRAMAQDIAEQYYRNVVSLHRADDGTLIEDATREIQLHARQHRQADAQARAEFEQFLREAVDAVPGLRRALYGAIN